MQYQGRPVWLRDTNVNCRVGPLRETMSGTKAGCAIKRFAFQKVESTWVGDRLARTVDMGFGGSLVMNVRTLYAQSC